MPLTVILMIISFPSPTLSFNHSRLKTFFFCKSFPLQPFFFFFRTDYTIPHTFTVTSEHIRSYFLVFFCFTLFSCCFRAVECRLRANVKIASRIVSYRTVFVPPVACYPCIRLRQIVSDYRLNSRSQRYLLLQSSLPRLTSRTANPLKLSSCNRPRPDELREITKLIKG